MVGSLAAIAVVVVGGFFALRSVTVGEAERDTRERVELQGALVESAGLSDGLLRGDVAAVARLDDVVVGRLLSPSVVRVKVWSRDGRVLYSDEPALIGRRFRLGAEELALFSRGGAEAELSDLSKPENRYERQEGKLLEAHTPIRTPDGTPVLFETYQRFDALSASGQRLLRALSPTLMAALAVLLLFQVPLSWSLARRLQRGHRERERLLERAIEASDRERRRIAADLHDGVVQDLAGVAFGLAPLADGAARRGDDAEAAALRESSGRLRHGVRALRTLLVEIHPPSLDAAGLETALSDLLSPLAAAGVATELEVDDRAAAGSGADALVYRVAREALRNVATHAGARHVRVELSCADPGAVELTVVDDGRGFDAGRRAVRAEDGHLGLTLLEELVAQAGGTLTVTSQPEAGTTVALKVPSA
ncbi:MAG: two-component sensor histidine kinase [Conexibacter sp.]|nr:two-component sensor histidine kinase [Conexibacter sp.]